jgi:hypothetical protein
LPPHTSMPGAASASNAPQLATTSQKLLRRALTAAETAPLPIKRDSWHHQPEQMTLHRISPARLRETLAVLLLLPALSPESRHPSLMRFAVTFSRVREQFHGPSQTPLPGLTELSSRAWSDYMSVSVGTRAITLQNASCLLLLPLHPRPISTHRHRLYSRPQVAGRARGIARGKSCGRLIIGLKGVVIERSVPFPLSLFPFFL